MRTAVWVRLAVAVGLIGAAGCGSGHPKVYPVRGTVAVAGGDAGRLAGHHVEAVSTADPAVRASGVIGPDGSFALETLHAGAILKGAQEGKYQVRLVLSDDDGEGKKPRRPGVATRYFKAKESGLTLDVPAASEVRLELSAR